MPQIIFQGANVSGATQNVIVGQQIALTIGHPPLGLTANSRTWSGVNAGQAIASWTPGQNPQVATSNTDSFNFYWVNAGTSGQASYTVTYSWTLDNAQSNSASVTFHVSGPSGLTVNTTPQTLAANGVNIIAPPTNMSATAPILGLAAIGAPGN